jgi:hypothetical protein
VLEPLGEVVADLLELLQREQPRPGVRADRPLDALARVRLAEQLAQLRLETGDLVAQRAPRRALVDLDFRRNRRPDFQQFAIE